MNSTPNKDALIARADEQLARAHEQIARAGEQLARVSEQFSKIERDAAHDASLGSGPQPPLAKSDDEPGAARDASIGSSPQPPGRSPARRGLIGLLSAACVVSIVVVALVLQSSRGGVQLIGAQWGRQPVSTSPLSPKNSPLPAQTDPSPVQVTAAEAAPPQVAPSSHTGPQDTATAASAVSALTQLVQKMTGDLANLQQEMERLKAKQDQLASDNAKAVEQLRAKQDDMMRLLAKVSEQSAQPATSPHSAGPTQSPQVRARPQAPPPRRQYPPRWQYYYDDEW